MKLLPTCALLALAGAAGLGAQDLPEWVLQLSRIKRQARAAVEHLPNTTCQETVERYLKPRSSGEFTLRDTLRFQVAFVAGKELYALAGADRFEELELSDMVHDGTIGNGTFSGAVHNLFEYDNGRTTGWGRETLMDRPAWRFDFEIPERLAGYRLQNAAHSGTVGVRGSFWADAATLDLLRIEEHATDIPLDLLMNDVATVIDYARARIGGADALLPRTAEVTIHHASGRQSRNVTRFLNCREYTSESVVHFGLPENTPLPPAVVPRKK